MSSVPPALILIAGALLAAVTPPRLRPWVAVAAAALTALHVFLSLSSGTIAEATWLGMRITPLRVDGLSLIFGYAFAIM
ncbi:MAG: Na+/H+ antiporter subunit D, partial [Chloroflexota bacterium]